MAKNLKINNQEDWAQFAIGYLHLTILACLEIDEEKYDGENLKVDVLYIPALFNLKHGIEILLKTLSIKFLQKEILDQFDYSHDIEEIFSKLRKDVKEERLKRAAKIYNEKYAKNHKIPSGKSIFDELESLVKKYHNLDFLKEKIGVNYVVMDADNTAFKYPTNNLKIQINYEKLSKTFTKSDALKLITDAANLEKILWQLLILFNTEKLES